jgi:hypothetical protein
MIQKFQHEATEITEGGGKQEWSSTLLDLSVEEQLHKTLRAARARKVGAPRHDQSAVLSYRLFRRL